MLFLCIGAAWFVASDQTILIPNISNHHTDIFFVNIRGEWEDSGQEVTNLTKVNVGKIYQRKNELKVDFMAFGTYFQIRAFKQKLQNFNLKIINKDKVVKEKMDYSKIPYYSGKLLGKPTSSVFGYLWNGTFRCVIRSDRNVFIVEYIDSKNSNARIIAVLESDIHVPPFDSNLRVDFQRDPVKRQKDPADSFRHRTCGVHAFADYTMYTYFDSNKYRVITEMIHFIEIANSIFRQIDFDFDGRPDYVGFAVSNVTIFAKLDSKLHEGFMEEKKSDKLLTSFSKIPNKSCVGFLFLMKKTLDKSSRSYKQACNYTTARKKCNRNVGLLSLHDSKNRLVAGWKVAKLLSNLLGVRQKCSSDDKRDARAARHRHYDSQLPMNILPCYVLSMASNFNKSGVCMRKDKPLCGNMVVDDGEECDCGSVHTCPLIDPCCIPSDRANGCKIRRRAGDICSPVSDPRCCAENCRPINRERCKDIYTECGSFSEEDNIIADT